MTAVPPKSLATAIDHINRGGRLCVPTCTRVSIIDSSLMHKWELAGYTLLKEEGDGYRMRQGKSSVYLLPGQLKMID